jgi:YegS/Rv2252/BmrU family lipid kinase
VTGAPSFADDRALAIVNPFAGHGTGERIARRMAEDFRAQGVRVDIARTPARDEGARLAREAAADGYRFILAVGGDGTANEIANGLVDSTAVLGLYPIGSGNDFARALGYPRRRRDILGFLRSARPRSIDVGELNGRVFVNAAGVGIDGHVSARVEATSRIVGATIGYFVGSLVGIATYRPQPMRLVIDGELSSGRFLSVVAANGTHFGSGMHVAPQASLDDGLLDVVIAGDLSPWSSLVALAKLYRGTHVDGRRIVVRRARVVEVELERPLAMQLDGEVRRADHLSIRVRPRALQVLAR